MDQLAQRLRQGLEVLLQLRHREFTVIIVFKQQVDNRVHARDAGRSNISLLVLLIG